jgi:hypothetical protein
VEIPVRKLGNPGKMKKLFVLIRPGKAMRGEVVAESLQSGGASRKDLPRSAAYSGQIVQLFRRIPFTRSGGNGAR